MAGETGKLKTRLASLNTSLGELESLLEPLLTQSLPETLLSLDPVQQAKFQTVLPYVIYDLIFIYLKTKGIDPKSHGVVPELDRVRQYFQKIDHAENPPIKRSEVDKDAAGRFIKHAITQAKSKGVASSQAETPLPSTAVPLKVTTKMIARAQYERALEKERDVEEDVLDVYDDADPGSSDDYSASEDGKSAGETDQAATEHSRRQRPPVDPFAGYDEESTIIELNTTLRDLQSGQTYDDAANTKSTTPPNIRKKEKNKGKQVLR